MTTQFKTGEGIRFQQPEHGLNLVMRFRIQNLVQYDDLVEAGGPTLLSAPRRARFRLGGAVYDPKLRFNLQLGFSRTDVDTNLDLTGNGNPNIIRDASVSYDLTPYLSVAFGQMKLPGNRSRVISSGEMQMIDRSLLNRAFNLDRDFALEWTLNTGHGEDPHAVIQAALSGGGGRNSVARSSMAGAATLRAEILPSGDFKNDGDYVEGDLEFEESLKTSFGLTSHWNRNPSRMNGATGIVFQDDQNRLYSTTIADALAKYQGWSFSAEWMWKRWILNAPSALDLNNAGWGLNIQAGKMLSRSWEAVARYTQVKGNLQVESITAGVNRYWIGHRLKGQLDASRTFFSFGPQLSLRMQLELGI